ncbi:hypothetical protein [Nonomuraea rhodomycinica]|uniref:Uncharacterized protein n=1 Tax=Nonomuraea rhodomycinica TaxID=1712872 RepID=A0A7Y6J073_9ACTN|nr:hypothetical protein [Nonomuraea rhodomycinica]NUW46269.1 hypothetical protein [Nonomuraea rhodomycinica]
MMSRLARAVELKADLVHFATSGRFAAELGVVLDRFYSDETPADEAAAFLPVDFFAHQHALPGGDTVVDRFLAETPGLDRADVELVASWKIVVEGVFEVRAVDEAAVLLFNLVDELVYRAFSNLGEGAFAPLEPGMFVVGRLIPLGADWLISAPPAVHTAGARDTLVEVAARLALAHPEWVFRNPVLLAQAREAQRAQRRCFTEYFGADLIVLPGADVAEMVRGYLAHQVARLGGPPPRDIDPPAPLAAARTVGLIFDEVAGLGYYAEFGQLEELFNDPSLVVRAAYRDLLSAYLRGDTVSPVPLQRLAERDPAKASEVFAGLLGRKGFDWERSGELLLRAHKPGHFAGPPLPTVTPVTAAIAEHLGLPMES